jgi:Family of unknown function (DUF6134)
MRSKVHGGRHRASANRLTGLLLMGVALFVPGWSRAGAADIEVRDFTIQVDGKNAGEYHMTIHRQDDGTVSMAAQSDVQVKVLLVPVYNYTYRGLEVWKAGRLQHFECSGKENSRTFTVSADAVVNGLQVKANGQEHTIRPDVWTTSYWQLPDARFRNQPLPLMRCDNGQDSTGHLQFIGMEKISVGGQEQSYAHYRVMNIVPHDLWYDGQERLVRHEWTADGHRTVIDMVRATRREGR